MARRSLLVWSPSTILSFALVLVTLVASSRAGDVSPAETRLKADVADEGRARGTPGIEVSADYIAAAFKDAGLRSAPGDDGYFQPFSIGGDAHLGDPLTLRLRGPDGKSLSAQPKVEFTPLAIGV